MSVPRGLKQVGSIVPSRIGMRKYSVMSKNGGRHSLETSYENYTNVSKNYDTYRRVVGSHIVTNALSRTLSDKIEKETENNCENAYNDRSDPNTIMRQQSQNGSTEESQFSGLSVLDAGCGTGNYLSSLRHLGLGHLYGIDVNIGMYGAAHSKFENDTNITIQNGSVTELSQHFEYESMDGIIINQVIHHLDTDESRAQNFGRARKAIKECYKVLKPGGTLCINHCTPIQIGYGYWYLHFMPKTRQKVMARYPKDRWMRTELKSTGFKGISAMEKCNENKKAEDTIERPLFIYDTFFKPEMHYQFNGVFEDNWRSACSIWSLASDEEIQQCQNSVTEKELSFNIDKQLEFIQDDQMLLSYIGCSTTYVAFKP